MSRTFYSRPSAPMEGALSLLALAYERPAYAIPGFVGRGDALTLVQRVLYFHRVALEAELEGKWRKADFFWKECHAALKKAWGKFDAWRVANVPAGTRQSDDNARAAELRGLVANEIIVDGHCALYNGYASQKDGVRTESRAFVHIGYLREVLKIIEAPYELQLELLRPAIEAQVEACKSTQQWSEAIRLCEEAWKSFPDTSSFRDLLITLHHQAAAANLGSADGQQTQYRYIENARILERSIANLQSILKKDPYAVSAYYYLADLFHRRAVALANAGLIADALAAIRWSLAYDRSDVSAAQTQEKLFSLLKQFESQLAKVEAEIAQQPGMSLTDEGVRLRDQVKRARRPAGEVVPESEADRISEAFYAAHARDVWQQIGIPPPVHAWDKRAQELLEALSHVMSLVRPRWLRRWARKSS